MKYYSEKLDKMFDSQSELFKAEKAESTQEKKLNKEKLDIAKEMYDKKCKEASDILEKAREKAEEYIKQAKELYIKAADVYDEAADKAVEIYTSAKKKYDEATNKYDTNEKLSTSELFDEILDFIRNW